MDDVCQLESFYSTRQMLNFLLPPTRNIREYASILHLHFFSLKSNLRESQIHFIVFPILNPCHTFIPPLLFSYNACDTIHTRLCLFPRKPDFESAETQNNALVRSRKSTLVTGRISRKRLKTKCICEDSCFSLEFL